MNNGKKESKLHLKNSLYDVIVNHSFHGKIPPERELSERLGVNRFTLRKALDELIAEGKLYRKPRKGTYIFQLHTKVVGFVADMGKLHPYGNMMSVICGVCRELEKANEMIRFINPKNLEELCSLIRTHHIGYVRFISPPSFCGGCDGEGSPMENQLQYMEKVFDFYAEFRKRIPEVITELASPGVERLSPKWLSTVDMISSLDALSDMPLAMAALDRQMLAPSCKCGLHIELQPGDRLYEKLNTALLGRLVLSGDPTSLSPAEKEIVKKFLAFYNTLLPVLEQGSYLLGHIIGESCVNPSGWQVFYKKTPGKQLTVFHIFSGTEEKITFDVPPGMEETTHFARETFWHSENGKMELPPCKKPISGAVLFTEKKK